MKRFFTTIATIVIFSSFLLHAQNYKTALGGRLGFFSGFTAKHFLNDQNAVEGIVSFRWTGCLMTGLYEYQKQLNTVENLDWFVGVGGHLGFWNNGYFYNDHYYSGGGSLGGDFIGGLEYTFKTAPLTLGIDLKPAFNIIGENHWWGNGLGISIRYVLK
jgi:hypothetical protein